ncbi:MAG: phytanoyl-CoA dioxygenase family protein [Geminicoccaceae bacterium]
MLETLAAGIERNCLNLTGRASYKGESGSGTFFGDYCNWDRIPEYRDFIFHSPAAAVARELMGSKGVRLFHEHVLVKEPSTDVATPWHQDQPYYCVDCEETVSFWIPLDPVPRDRTLEFVKASHASGKLYRPQRFNGQALNENDGMEPVPDIDGHRETFDILGWPLEPGDAVAFHYRTLHGAPGNSSRSSARRAFSLRLLGDGATFNRREGVTTSPPFREVDLPHGAPLDHPAFPSLV